MNATDIELESAAESCERWALGCGGLVVIGLLAEFALAIAHPSPGSLWGRWGSAVSDALVTIGVAGEVLFSRMGFARSRELNRRSNDRLAVAESRASEANVRASEANQKAEEAALDLAKLKAPRSLDGERHVAFVDKLRPFTGQAYDLSTPRMLERGSHFDTQLMAALCDAGWKLQSVPPMGRRKLFDSLHALFAFPKETPLAEIPVIAVGISDGAIGVFVGYDRGDRMEAHAALLGAFKEAGIDAQLTSMSPPMPGIVPLKETPGVIHIMIGSKS